ncbi:nitroreductase family protein [Amycolatopsis sp. NPDC054798]
MPADLTIVRGVPPRARDYDRTVPVELVQPARGKRLRLSRTAVLDYIYGGGNEDVLNEALSAETPPDSRIQHWLERNWSWAAPYYLASKRVRVADRDDPDGTTRRETLKNYLEESAPPAPRLPDGDRIPLPAASAKGTRSVGDVLVSRRTGPRPGLRTLKLSELGEVLDTGTDLLRRSVRYASEYEEEPLRLLNSLGCALDVYVVAYDVEGVPSGLHRYLLGDHALVTMRAHEDTDALREEMQRILVGQPAPRTAAATIVLVADFDRYQWRYRHERAMRHLYVDAGHVAGYLLLAATSRNKQAHISPASSDTRGLRFLERDPAKDQIVYSISFS